MSARVSSLFGCTVCCSVAHVFLFFFFFSSRRRHTRFDCDWSSDVCSSDLHAEQRFGFVQGARAKGGVGDGEPGGGDRRSEERRVGKSVDLGGRRIIKKKKEKSDK